MRKRLIPVILMLCVMLAAAGCKKKEKVDLSDVTTPSQEQTTEAPTQETKETETAGETTTAAPKGAYAQETTYLHKNLGIKYPQITNMEDSEKQTAVNDQIKEDVMAVIEAYGLDTEKDSLNLTYKVSALDRDKIVIFYEGSFEKEGALEPTALFLSDTISLKTGKHTRLSDYVDGKTLANLLSSDGDYQVMGEDADTKKEVRKYLASQKASELEKILNNADFGGTGKEFPKSFSYEKQGVIYFTVPVSHALGDYALLAYTPETK